MRAGKPDVGGAAISVTPGGEEEFDLLPPILDAALQIMVRGKGQEAGSNALWDLLGPAFSPTILVWLALRYCSSSFLRTSWFLQDAGRRYGHNIASEVFSLAPAAGLG